MSEYNFAPHSTKELRQAIVEIEKRIAREIENHQRAIKSRREYLAAIRQEIERREDAEWDTSVSSSQEWLQELADKARKEIE